MYKFRKSCLMRGLAILLLASFSLLVFEDTASAWPWDIIVDAVESVGEGILDTTSDVADTVANATVTVAKTVTDATVTVAKTVTDATVTVAKTAADATVAVAQGIGTTLTTVADNVGGGISSVTETISSTIDSITNTISEFAEEHLGPIGTGLKYFINAHTMPFTFQLDALSTSTTLSKNLLTVAGKGLEGTLETEDIRNFSRSIWQNAGQSLNSQQKLIDKFSQMAAQDFGAAGAIAGAVAQSVFASVTGSAMDALKKSESLADKAITGDATLDDLKDWGKAIAEVAAEAAAFAASGGTSAAATTSSKIAVFVAKNQDQLCDLAENIGEIGGKLVKGENVSTEEWVKLGALGAQLAAGGLSAYVNSPGLKSDLDFAKGMIGTVPDLYSVGNTVVNAINGDDLSSKDYIQAAVSLTNALASMGGTLSGYGKPDEDDDDRVERVINHIGEAAENFVDLQNAPQATPEEESNADDGNVIGPFGPMDIMYASPPLTADEYAAMGININEIQNVFTQVNMANTSPTVPQMPMGDGGFFSNFTDLITTTIAETSESFVTDLTKTPQSVTFTIEIQQQ